MWPRLTWHSLWLRMILNSDLELLECWDCMQVFKWSTKELNRKDDYSLPHLQAIPLHVVCEMDKLRKRKFYGKSLPLYLESTASLWIGSLPFLPATAQENGKLVLLTVTRRAGLLWHLREELFFTQPCQQLREKDFCALAFLSLCMGSQEFTAQTIITFFS